MARYGGLAVRVNASSFGPYRHGRHAEVGEYKPAVMTPEGLYWMGPEGTVADIPRDCEVPGQIERISPQKTPPWETFEAIGFSDEFLGADIFYSASEDKVYVYSQESGNYTPFQPEK